MSLIDDIRSLVRDHDEIQNGLYDLWTWLPSYYLCMRAHGDYVFEFKPAPPDLLMEACQILNMNLIGDNIYLGEEVTDFTQISYECMCGEVHEPDDEPHSDFMPWDENKLVKMNEKYLGVKT